MVVMSHCKTRCGRCVCAVLSCVDSVVAKQIILDEWNLETMIARGNRMLSRYISMNPIRSDLLLISNYVEWICTRRAHWIVNDLRAVVFKHVQRCAVSSLSFSLSSDMWFPELQLRNDHFALILCLWWWNMILFFHSLSATANDETRSRCSLAKITISIPYIYSNNLLYFDFFFSARFRRIW